jgi:beta-galactosidase
MSPRYFEELSPGHGKMPPRAVTASNAPRLDLNGDWAFRFSPVGLDGTDGFVAASATGPPTASIALRRPRGPR